MSLYDDASLVFYPSGYKASKAYSLKPTDGSGDLTFTRASTATRVNESGLIEEVASNVPRIDFTSGCGNLLLESQRTNVIIYSTDITSNSAYLLGDTTNTSGQTSPAGGTDAYLIAEDSTTAQHFIDFGRSSTTTNTSVTSSFFIKPSGRNKIRITNYNNLVNQFGWVELDLSNNSFIQSSIGGNVSYVSYTITDFPNGWKRVSLTTIKASSIYFYTIRLNFLDNSGNLSYLGDGASGAYVYGIQQEHNAAYPTSLINTSGTAVTRVVDSASVTTPAGVTQITETFGNGSTNVITSIPATYTASLGNIQSVIMI